MSQNDDQAVQTELQFTLMLGAEERTLHIIDRRSSESVLRVHIDHETFSRLLGGQIVTIPGLVFTSEHYGKYACFSERSIKTTSATFEEDLKELQRTVPPGVVVIPARWNPHKAHGEFHKVSLVEWRDEPPER
jgi:LmbE family N-acetylglucosaminyl deacetylase